ncbi:MAG: glycosyltransferase family 4 protein [Kineosporiaceae bacterium]|nr:glycosyltransferase family 4 protein [Kineosporiaceae bacterium]
MILLARLTGARVVCHVHEAEDDVPAPAVRCLGELLPAVQAVVVHSRASRERASAPRRCQPSGVGGLQRCPRAWPDQVRPPRESSRRAGFGWHWSGGSSPRKGTDVAVEALQRLVAEGVDAELTLAGNVFPGYEWFEQQVRERVEQAGLSDRVQWLGMLPEVWGCLADADIALVPSRVEPFGNAAVEAILAQRPVVAGDTQGLREIVTPGVNGRLCLPGDAASLASAIQQTIADWPAARSAAGPAREAAEQRFGVARYRADIVSTLAQLAPRAARQSRRIPFRSKENHR